MYLYGSIKGFSKDNRIAFYVAQVTRERKFHHNLLTYGGNEVILSKVISAKPFSFLIDT